MFTKGNMCSIIESEVEHMSRVINDVDVICEHKSDGDVIPLKFRIMNDDGVFEAYTIKGYRQIFRKDTYTTPDGVTVGTRDRVYECRVVVLDMYKTIRLYFDTINCSWRIAI